jgi:hypothetical protein
MTVKTWIVVDTLGLDGFMRSATSLPRSNALAWVREKDEEKPVFVVRILDFFDEDILLQK